MTDHDIDVLVIKTMSAIMNYVDCDDHGDLCVEGRGLDVLRDAMRLVRGGAETVEPAAQAAQK